MSKISSGNYRSARVESEEKLTWRARLDRAWASVKEIVGKVWLYVVIGIAVGAGIHGYVPERALADIMGRNQWWSVSCGACSSRG